LLPSYQLGLGLAEYRPGQYAAAERTLTVAEQTVREYHDRDRLGKLKAQIAIWGYALDACATISPPILGAFRSCGGVTGVICIGPLQYIG